MHLTDNWLIRKLESVDSTQEYAKQLIIESKLNFSQQVAITSLIQTKGYGRLSREWESLNGNLHLTLIVPVPSDIKNIQECGQISYVTGVAIGEAISSLVSSKVSGKIQYKWVNDILINEKKVSGIIIERLQEFFVIGIGVNLLQTPEVIEGDGTTPQIGMTSIMEESGMQITSDTFIEVLLPKFSSLYNQLLDSGFEVLRTMWKSGAYKIGEKISIKITENQKIDGIFMDIAMDGALVIKTSDGTREVYVGDFFPLS